MDIWNGEEWVRGHHGRFDITESDEALAWLIEYGQYSEYGGQVGESEWDERDTTTPTPDRPE